MIFAVDISSRRLRIAQSFGADRIINSHNEDPVAVIRSLTANRGVDLALEAVGRSLTYTQCVQALRRRGTLLALGFMEDEICLPIQPILFQELDIVGCTGFTWESETVLQLIAEGKIRVGPLISHRFPLDQAQQAFETFADPKAEAIKVLLLL